MGICVNAYDVCMYISLANQCNGTCVFLFGLSVLLQHHFYLLNLLLLGARITAVASTQGVYYSTDFGKTFTKSATAPALSWRTIVG